MMTATSWPVRAPSAWNWPIRQHNSAPGLMPCWRRAAAAAFSGDPAFLDSAYAQVQSDVGVVGTVALLTSLAALSVHVIRQCRDAGRRTDWAACGVLGV